MASSFLHVAWIVGVYLNMVKWKGDDGSGVGVVVSGFVKNALVRFKFGL